MDLSTRTRSTFPIPIVEVGGEIDLESGPYLRDQLRSVMRAHGPCLAVDLTGVTFIDCSGVNALLASYRLAQMHGGWMRLIAVSPCVGRIIDITGLQQVLSFRPSARAC